MVTQKTQAAHKPIKAAHAWVQHCAALPTLLVMRDQMHRGFGLSLHVEFDKIWCLAILCPLSCMAVQACLPSGDLDLGYHMWQTPFNGTYLFTRHSEDSIAAANAPVSTVYSSGLPFTSPNMHPRVLKLCCEPA